VRNRDVICLTVYNMFRVDQRLAGQGLWNMAALPVTLQAALGRARALQDAGAVADVRIVPAPTSAPLPQTGQLLDVTV
jgi:hypothetical protein